MPRWLDGTAPREERAVSLEAMSALERKVIHRPVGCERLTAGRSEEY
jgi:predicted RNA-binding protein Jag